MSYDDMLSVLANTNKILLFVLSVLAVIFVSVVYTYIYHILGCAVIAQLFRNRSSVIRVVEQFFTFCNPVAVKFFRAYKPWAMEIFKACNTALKTALNTAMEIVKAALKTAADRAEDFLVGVTPRGEEPPNAAPNPTDNPIIGIFKQCNEKRQENYKNICKWALGVYETTCNVSNALGTASVCDTLRTFKIYNFVQILVPILVQILVLVVTFDMLVHIYDMSEFSGQAVYCNSKDSNGTRNDEDQCSFYLWMGDLVDTNGTYDEINEIYHGISMLVITIILALQFVVCDLKMSFCQLIMVFGYFYTYTDTKQVGGCIGISTVLQSLIYPVFTRPNVVYLGSQNNRAFFHVKDHLFLVPPQPEFQTWKKYTKLPDEECSLYVGPEIPNLMERSLLEQFELTPDYVTYHNLEKVQKNNYVTRNGTFWVVSLSPNATAPEPAPEPAQEGIGAVVTGGIGTTIVAGVYWVFTQGD